MAGGANAAWTLGKAASGQTGMRGAAAGAAGVASAGVASVMQGVRDSVSRAFGNPREAYDAGSRAAFTATGKSFLSHMSDFEVKRLYANGLPEPRTPNSVRSIESLLEDLRETRKRGYSVDDQQVAEGIICFGASVLDSRNMPIAGVAVSLLADQTSEEDRKQIIANVRRITSRLSIRMGADL